ncbi:dihydroxyacetone kinase 1 [Syncephalis pseudoplumigaleata]|uniref:Dihydroxyacetone kinase 1 n=1 Tax=Syncephalis pseudoplumigaleata TaxID=1712513 RepID=A0A4P9Z2M0_9FUNG|nr:dihydroxyacetone kinase 1 [Syncephalis pseudoplumigaleata]|eukprot:RKP26031.1 dihydroxyacetone kinase 1 [Syncephalis pseudoplumigaleata]
MALSNQSKADNVSRKHIINQRETLVDDALHGYVLAHPHLQLVKEHKIVIRKDIGLIREKQVTLITGGGAGHEPTAIGYVGAGMISAAVSGNLFASPSPRQILAAIRLCRSPHGTLLLVKNYTGDVLNFGLARERAAAEGIKVAMLVVADDCAVGKERGGLVGRRGLAGAVLVHKIAGALAARGAPLDAVLAMARSVVANVSTIGVALEPCYVPGADESNLRQLGIHGEPGCEVVPLMPSRQLAERMLAMVTATDETDPDRAFVPWSSGQPADDVAVLVNNLGGTSALELSSFTKDVVELVEQRGFPVKRIYSDAVITSLNTPGVSITLLRLSDARLQLELLDAPTEATGWPHGSGYNSDAFCPADSPQDHQAQEHRGEHDTAVENIVRAACASVIRAEPEITRLDTITGDGDCGDTLKAGANAILSALDARTLPTAPLHRFALGVADLLEGSMGGTSGALYCIFFNALATHFATSTATDATLWQNATTYTPARKGDRTMLDALSPFVETFAQGASFAKAVDAAREGMAATQTMRPRLGRATYVGNAELAKVADAGAYGVVSILEGIHAAMDDQ